MRNSNNRRTVKSILLVNKLLGLLEMMSRLVNDKLQLARMASFKNDFLCTLLLQSLCLTRHKVNRNVSISLHVWLVRTRARDQTISVL